MIIWVYVVDAYHMDAIRIMCPDLLSNLTCTSILTHLHSSWVFHFMTVISVWSIFLTVIKYLPNEALSTFTACLLKEQDVFKTCLSLTVENESQVYALDQMQAIIYFPRC